MIEGELPPDTPFRKCSKCQGNLPLVKFSVIRRNADGSPRYYNSWCNPCRTKANRERLGAKEKPKPYIDEESKECLSCHKILLISDFYPSEGGRLGVASYCRACHGQRYNDAEKARAASSRYREKHKERWRASHRLHQFKRRYQIQVTSDGSVTDDFLRQIYATEICYWCEETVPESLRTLEHIIELCAGGTHTADNITMACRSCNSRRNNRNVKD